MRPFPIVKRLLWQPQCLRGLLCTNAPPKEISVAVSSLRIDTVAAAGLDISRKHIWEAFIDGLVSINGHHVSKKSSHVQEGDIIEVDTVLREKQSQRSSPSDSESEHKGTMVKRGRVVVKEIGAQTRKGGYRLTLVRYKQFVVFRRTITYLSSHAPIQ